MIESLINYDHLFQHTDKEHANVLNTFYQDAGLQWEYNKNIDNLLISDDQIFLTEGGWHSQYDKVISINKYNGQKMWKIQSPAEGTVEVGYYMQDSSILYPKSVDKYFHYSFHSLTRFSNLFLFLF